MGSLAGELPRLDWPVGIGAHIHVRPPPPPLQHKYYLPIALVMAFVVPTLVCGLGWGDYYGE